MISSRSPSLLKPFQRWSPLSIVASRVTTAPSPAPPAGGGVVVRNFASPAVRRFRKKQILQGNGIHQDLPHTFKDMDNHTLLTVAALENHDARIEVLKRHIMSVDRCSHAEATVTFQEIAKKNREGMALAALPYKLGIFAGVAAAIGSIPMVFDLNTALWFNEYFVTTDVAEKEDLETALEVGSWTWNWMEPPLGTMSFALLAVQFSRAQMDNLGIKPYTSTLKIMRGKKLSAAFPQYDPKVILDFSETDPLSTLMKRVA